ncbi:unnamed protein product [Gadus morhua 'NCC']
MIASRARCKACSPAVPFPGCTPPPRKAPTVFAICLASHLGPGVLVRFSHCLAQEAHRSRAGRATAHNSAAFPRPESPVGVAPPGAQRRQSWLWHPSRVQGPERSWFEEQVELDSAFLRSLNVLDYSLLIGQQALHLDELDQRHSLATLVNRTTKSLDLDEGPPTRPLLERQRSLDEEQDSGVPGGGGVPLGTLPGGGAEGEFHARHRRLLPDFQNAVHVLDGPQRRYFVGIIDVFTQYGWRKRLEHWYKALRFPGRSFSTVSPHAYSLRLCQWVRSRTQ